VRKVAENLRHVTEAPASWPKLAPAAIRLAALQPIAHHAVRFCRPNVTRMSLATTCTWRDVVAGSDTPLTLPQPFAPGLLTGGAPCRPLCSPPDYNLIPTRGSTR
jgi:hypothetical protein